MAPPYNDDDLCYYFHTNRHFSVSYSVLFFDLRPTIIGRNVFLAGWVCERGKKWSSHTLNGGLGTSQDIRCHTRSCDSVFVSCHTKQQLFVLFFSKIVLNSTCRKNWGNICNGPLLRFRNKDLESALGTARLDDLMTWWGSKETCKQVQARCTTWFFRP